MLTAEKVEIFKRYKGYYDGYYIQNKEKKKVISDDEWILLNNYIQNIFLIRNGKAAQSFTNEIMEHLIKDCDNIETVDLILKLEKYLNEFILPKE